MNPHRDPWTVPFLDYIGKEIVMNPEMFSHFVNEVFIIYAKDSYNLVHTISVG